jgi:imidazolonepropionase-like amidohydrolase
MGAIVGAGSDIGGTMGGFFGRFTDELEHYTQSSISNFETLRMATSTNAQIIDMQNQIGIVNKGFYADLITVVGNPLKDIYALRKVKMVMKGGVIIKNEEA